MSRRHQPPAAVQRKVAVRAELEQVFADGRAAGLTPDELASLGQLFERWAWDAKERSKPQQVVPPCEPTKPESNPVVQMGGAAFNVPKPPRRRDQDPEITVGAVEACGLRRSR